MVGRAERRWRPYRPGHRVWRLVGYGKRSLQRRREPPRREHRCAAASNPMWSVWLPRLRPYAEAINQGDAINKCPPGGDATIQALADLLGRDPAPLDGEATDEDTVAYIREAECIGCTKCIQACPVDAIVGAAKQMHTVIEDECTGCDLCVAPCPVDCIDMLPRRKPLTQWDPIVSDRQPLRSVHASQ